MVKPKRGIYFHCTYGKPLKGLLGSKMVRSLSKVILRTASVQLGRWALSPAGGFGSRLRDSREIAPSERLLIRIAPRDCL